MTLVFDRRVELGYQPGTHALIVGVSAYRHLPQKGEDIPPGSLELTQLSSTSITAYKISRWLVDHQEEWAAPLATVRLLLSPSSEEQVIEPALNGLADPATLQNFLVSASEWRRDALSHRDNYTWFYFCGNGLERDRNEQLLLYEDFGDGIGPALRNSVSVNNLFLGMAPGESQPDIARTQLYFIDASRSTPRSIQEHQWGNATPVFDAYITGIDDRSAAIFYATAPGNLAYGIPGEHSIFGSLLLRCLEGAAGQDASPGSRGQSGWVISVQSLVRGLEQLSRDINREWDINQEFVVSGLVRDREILYLKEPPLVEVSVEIDPVDALPYATLRVENDERQVVLEKLPPLDPHPYQFKIPGGFYNVSIRVDPPDPRFVDQPGRWRPIMPPVSNYKFRMVP